MYLIAGLLFVILIVLIFMFMRQTPAATSAPPPPPTPSATGTSVSNLQIGDTILVPGAGDDFSDLNFTVDRRDRYEAKGENWFEVSGLYRGRRVYVEVYTDDETKVLINLANEDITTGNLGVGEEDLIKFDKAQDRSQGFSYKGSQWLYDWSGEIIYLKGSDSQGEGYYCWDFREQGGRRELCVEKWEGEPFEVILSRVVNPEDVQVFRS